jgi:hypothetical protein
MLDHYVRLFNISWVEPWMIEAMAIIAGALLLGLVVGKVMDFLNGDIK